MSKPRGIIYGMLALFRRSSAYPNRRLLLIGVSLLPWVMVMPDPMDATTLPSVSSRPWLFQAVIYSRILVTVAQVAYFSGMVLIIFASARIGISVCRRRNRGNALALISDATPDFTPDSD
ncbi:MAG: hypothetical protein EXS05_20540 [Planctomycetaceae bacterium]|nr:hypothetical protein [Planctomycetaceae bacterium]